MTKVYIVRYGEYSNQGIAGAFSTEEKADHYCNIQNQIDSYESYWVDEYELDEYEKPKDAKVVTYYEVGIALEDTWNYNHKELWYHAGDFTYDDYEEKDVFTKPNIIIIHDSPEYSTKEIIVKSSESFEKAKKIAIEQYQIWTQQKLEEQITENK